MDPGQRVSSGGFGQVDNFIKPMKNPFSFTRRQSPISIVAKVIAAGAPLTLSFSPQRGEGIERGYRFSARSGERLACRRAVASRPAAIV